MSSSSRGYGERRVLPGDPLAVLEEFIPGPGTYVDEEGTIRASIRGTARYNLQARTVEVRPDKPLAVPRQGSDAVGLVTQVRHDLVLVELLGEVQLQPSPRWVREYSGRFLGALPIANVSEEFIKDLYDYYRPGDIILARVINNSNPYQLLTKAPQYGVILAECSRCGARLQPVNQRTMRCPRCGHVEKRKVSVLASSRLLRLDVRRSLLVPLR